MRPYLPVRWLTVLRYGRIGYTRRDSHEGELPCCSPAQLDEHMALLRRECTPIDTHQLRGFFAGEELPPRPVLVTFDRVYVDNLTHALPALSRHDIAAVFFVTTDCVGTPGGYLHDRIARLIRRSRRPQLSLRYPTQLSFHLPDERQQAIDSVMRLVQMHYRLDLPRLMTALREACGVADEASAERHPDEPLLMSWEQLRQLRDAGMTVASGGASGRALHTLSLQAATEELRRSRETLREQLGLQTDAIALPPGTPAGASLVLGEAMSGLGYRMCFTGVRGAMPLWRPAKPLQIQRLAPRPDDGEAQLRSALHWPALARRVW